MDNKVETIEYKGYKINIYQDECNENPIQEWDILCSFACFHRDYDLSSKEVQTGTARYNERKNPEYVFPEPEDLTNFINSKDCAIALPLYLYDHSGLTISVGNGGNPFYGRLPQGHAEFDTSKIGYVFVARDKLLKEYSAKKITKKILEKARKLILAEVNTFDDYLRGAVYGYMIEDKEGNEEGGSWGYFGYDFEKSGLLESARGEIDSIRDNIIQKHNKKLIEQIKNHVPVIYREPCPLVS